MKTRLSPFLKYAVTALAAFCAGIAVHPGSQSSPGQSVEVSQSAPPRRAKISNSKADGPAAAAGVSDSPASAWMDRIGAVLHRADALPPRELLAALQQSLTDSMTAESLLERQIFLTRLAEQEPESAFSWAASLPAGERSAAAVTALTVWASHDPAAAAAHFESSADDLGALSAAQRQGAAGLAAQWAKTDPAAALRWAAGLSPDLSGDALASAVRTLNRTDPAHVAEEINRMPEGFERTELIQSITRDQVRTSPSQAAVWVASIDPNGPEQSAAAAALMKAWSAKNPQAAQAWAYALPGGSLKDTALAALPARR